MQFRASRAQMRRGKALTRAFATIACVALLGTTQATAEQSAQAFPTRPVTLVVPFPAGGPLDTSARIIAERMRAPLGQPVVIENTAGASGSIGTGRVARAVPDGYTILVGGMPNHVLNGAVMTLPYDVVADFAPIALITNAPLLIVARKTMPAADLRELIAWLKANPDKATQGTAGVGTGSHIVGVFMQQLSGARFAMVPYRGAGPAMTDLLAGQIDLMIDPSSNTLPQVRAGLIKAYAVTAAKRLPTAPEIPSVDEAGLPDLHFLNWSAYYAPRDTPRPIINRLNAAIGEALADPAVRAKAAEFGQEIFPREMQTPDTLAAFHRAEIEKWWPIIKAAGIKAQ
jgi:tripartite-type tricarboxylate transporter receptor subunit TctC